jgi:hypothetical protein
MLKALEVVLKAQRIPIAGLSQPAVVLPLSEHMNETTSEQNNWFHAAPAVVRNPWMRSPLSFLGPAIHLIGTNASVLPASGVAFEDMAKPDVEEADDRFFGSASDSREGFQDFAENPAPD